jgi:hypothetical protein
MRILRRNLTWSGPGLLGLLFVLAWAGLSVATIPGGGSPGSIVNCSDLYVGQLVYDYWDMRWESISFHVKIYYAGNCEMRYEAYGENGVLEEWYWYKGGCYCGYPPSPYDPDICPSFDFIVGNSTDSSFEIVPTEDVQQFKIIDLDSGNVVYSHDAFVPAGTPVTVMTSNFDLGGNYATAGYVANGRIHGFMSFRRDTAGIVELGRMETWDDPDSSGLLVRSMTHVGGAALKVMIQRADDKSVYVVDGTLWSGEPVPSMTEWGMIIFGVVLLGFISWVFLKKRRRVIGVRA